MNRREVLRRGGGLLLAAGALAGCSEEPDGEGGAGSAAAPRVREREQYDSGTEPVTNSGWT